MFGFLRKKVGELASKISKAAEGKLDSGPAQPAAPKEKSHAKPLPAPAEAPKKAKRAQGRPSLATKIKQAIAGEAQLSSSEIDGFLWEFELALLEADVSQGTAEGIAKEMRKRLSEKRFKKGEDMASAVRQMVQSSIRAMMPDAGLSIVDKVKSGEKPFVIMFLGPNGAGKTTTLAKIAYMLKSRGISSLFAASDTFRAASIEQLQHHADALGIRLVKQSYGADPAAVAYDAISSAKAKGISCVLIDTAGRQETNKNLMEELKKIKRVAKPQLLIYVDEAIAGNALVDRVKEFKEAIGIDGIILSKMDMDAKGGGAISIASSTGIPVAYYGTGQSYTDLERFDPDELLKRIFE